MKRFALILTTVGALALLSTPAMASDNYFVRRSHGAVHHAQDHAALNYRAAARAAVHHNSHHYPTTRYQHAITHSRLNHQAGHDALRHHSAHDSGRYYSRYGHNSFGIRIGGFSLRLGH